MARSRNLKPTFFHDAELLECDFWVRLLFQGLWVYADRRGILAENLKQIKLDVFPGDNVDIDAGLAELAQRGFIERYTAAGKKCIHIRSFSKHQNPHKDEKPSDLPAPDEQDEPISPSEASTVQAPGNPGANPAITITVSNHEEQPLITDTAPEAQDAPAALVHVRYSAVFDVFWAEWQKPPSKGHGAKKEAYDAWKSLGLDRRGADAERQMVVDGLHRWQVCGRWLDGYVRDCHRWLSKRMFADDPPPDAPRKALPNGRADPNANLIDLESVQRERRTPEEQARLDEIRRQALSKSGETAEERWRRLHPEQAGPGHLSRR